MSTENATTPPFKAVIALNSDYSNRLVHNTLSARNSLFKICKSSLKQINSSEEENNNTNQSEYELILLEEEEEWKNIHLQWLEFEYINWSTNLLNGQGIASNYLIRKGLIRKAQFSYFLNKFKSKRPNSILNRAVPETHLFQIESPEYLEEALCELPEIKNIENDEWYKEINGEVENNSGNYSDSEENHRNYDSDSSVDEKYDIQKRLRKEKAAQAALNNNNNNNNNNNSNDNNNNPNNKPKLTRETNQWIMKASMVNQANGIFLIRSLADLEYAVNSLPEIQEWVVQRYIQNPLLIEGKKFHLRVYVLCIGNLAVYYYTDILALFAIHQYNSTEFTTESHITNTCANKNHPDYQEEKTVKLLSEIITDELQLNSIKQQIHDILHDIFEALHGEPTAFLPFPNCFELFGFDFLIDEQYQVFILEANAGPDFKQTGERLQNLVAGVMEETYLLAVEPYFKQLLNNKNSNNNKKKKQLNAALCSIEEERKDDKKPKKFAECYSRIVSETSMPRMNMY